MHPPEQPIGVLFVCLGNICRSPMAEGAFRNSVENLGLEPHFFIDSAGTSGWHQGNPPDHRARRTASNRGMDISQQSSRIVATDDFHRFDYILAMDTANLDDLQRSMPADSPARLDLLLAYGETEVREVPDPYYGGEDGFDYCLDLICDGASGLLQAIRNERWRE
jgi:protein-tyrosine phosphatase